MIAPWLGLVLLGGLLLRLVGLDWDQAHHLHPDERFLSLVMNGMRWPSHDLLAVFFDEATSTLNPRNVAAHFVYGDFPVVLVKGLSVLLGRDAYDQAFLVGRATNAVFDTGTILLVFLIGRRLYRDSRVALLGGLLYAIAPLAIQQAHFFVVDTMVTFFVAAFAYFVALIQTRGRFLEWVLAGASLGAALACKVSVLPAVLLLLAVATYLIATRGAPGKLAGPRSSRVVAGLVVSIASGFLVFRVLQPSAFASGLFGITLAPRWLANLADISASTAGDIDWPPGHQWAGRLPLVFPLQNMIVWGLGLPLGLTACVAWALAAWQLVRKHDWRHMIPVLVAALFFVFFGLQFVKYMRYFLPAYPLLTLLGAWVLVHGWDRAQRHRQHRRGWLRWTPTKAALLVGIVLIGSLLYTGSFTHIYTTPHSRISASQWIYAHVPAGAAIANETAWDDALPLNLDGSTADTKHYQVLDLEITGEDTPKKRDHMLETLDRCDYIFISSNRQTDSLTRLPLRFPMTGVYYQALFDGRLGFKRVAEFTSYPQIGPVQLPDQGAEEAWSVYDHPRVQLFEKTAGYSHGTARGILAEADLDAVVVQTARQATTAPGALLLTPAQQDADAAGGTWRQVFDPEGWGNRLPLAGWILALVVLGFLGFPYAWLGCRSLPDRGYGIGRLVALLLVAWLTWVLASLRLLQFGRGAIGVGLGVTAIGAALIVYRNRGEMAAWLRLRWRLLLLEELLFALAFIVMLAVRWANPDLWHPSLGGEKPMDLAFLTAVVKSSSFPPYDPWFSGGYINYYYFGLVPVALLIRLIGVVPAVAYNLAIPTFFGLLCSSSFTVALALQPAASAVARLPRRAALLALLGPLAVAVAGNLGEATLVGGQLLHHLPLHPSYWDPTRLITPGPGEPGPITEFPWFTFLYADLHAHLIALPYAVAVLAISLAAVRRSPGAAATSRLALYLLLALTLGALWPMNTWDYPVYALLALGALLSRAWQGRGQGGYRWLATAGLRWALVLALGYVLFLPFHRAYASAFAGFAPWRGSRTGIGEFLTIHGLFLFFIVSALALDLWRGRELAGPPRVVRAILRRPLRARRLLRLHRRMVSPSRLYVAGVYAIEFGVFAALLLALAGKLVPALLVGLGTVAAASMSRRPRPTLATGADMVLWQAVLAAVAVGALLALAVEFVVVKDIDVGRMNTVFKVYQQVWVLWALAAAVAAARLLRQVAASRIRWRVVWGGAAAALLSAALLYPALATPAKVQDRFDRSVGPGLDGTAFMSRAVQAEHGSSMPLVFDRDAIFWMQANVEGSPIVGEVNTTPVLYGWSSRYAMFTGNPDIVGWDNHERQQRGSAVPTGLITTRIADVQRAYGTTDAAEAYAVFHRYGVAYFVVGPLERAYYSSGQQKWDAADGCLWQRVYRNPGVSIYRVIASADDAAACRSWGSNQPPSGPG